MTEKVMWLPVSVEVIRMLAVPAYATQALITGIPLSWGHPQGFYIIRQPDQALGPFLAIEDAVKECNRRNEMYFKAEEKMRESLL